MGYKMNGFSGFGNSPVKQKEGKKILTPDSKLRKSEIPETHLYKGTTKTQKIEDLQERIANIEEDINQQDEATTQQLKDIGSLMKEIATLRKTGEK